MNFRILADVGPTGRHRGTFQLYSWDFYFFPLLSYWEPLFFPLLLFFWGGEVVVFSLLFGKDKERNCNLAGEIGVLNDVRLRIRFRRRDGQEKERKQKGGKDPFVPMKYGRRIYFRRNNNTDPAPVLHQLPYGQTAYDVWV